MTQEITREERIEKLTGDVAGEVIEYPKPKLAQIECNFCLDNKQISQHGHVDPCPWCRKEK